MNTSAWLADDTWWGSDKLSHLGWGTCVAEWLLVAGSVPSVYWLGLLAAAVAIEAIELRRFGGWQAAVDDAEDAGLAPPARPLLCDKASFKDIVWVLAGGVLAPPLMLVARWIGAS